MSTDVMEDQTLPEMGTESTPALNKDGSVRRKPGPKPGTKRTPRKVAAPGIGPAPARKSSSGVDYRPAIVGVAQIPQMLLGIASRVLNRPALALDGITVGIHAPGLAEALNETAKTEPAVQKMLDRLMVAGPYGLVIAAALPIGLQVLANHRVVEPNEQIGTFGPERLAEMAGQQLQAAGV